MHATVTVKPDPLDSFRAHCQADARSFVSATVARAEGIRWRRNPGRARCPRGALWRRDG
jgi:hypothetical protein